MSSFSVLRVGPFPDDNESAAHLRSALVEHFDKLQQRAIADANAESQIALHKQAQPFEKAATISISNRYFSAQVILAEIGDPLLLPHDDGACAAWTEDGIVLVFDSLLSNPKVPTSISASFDAMEAVHDRAVAADTAGDLLRLCVGILSKNLLFNNNDLSEKEYEQEYSRRVLWCLDRGYEYVEADLSEEGVLQGHDGRDKDGFARIVEAVSGTVWSSAIMEKRKKHELQESYSRDATATTQLKDAAAAAATEIGSYEPPDPLKLPPVLSSEESDEEREKKARAALLADEADAAVHETHIDDTDSKDTEMAFRQREEVEQERALSALEGSLKEATRLRELSKAGQLSDDERRKRAGDAAMLIMDMMGHMGLEGASSDDDESSLEDGKEEKIDVTE